MTDTTGPEGQDDAGLDDNWQSRYQGLQRVVSAKDRELAAAVAERDSLKAAQDAENADRVAFEEWRKAQEAAEAEQTKRAQYEALRAEFEAPDEPPPTPLQHNESRVWAGPDYPRKASKEDAETVGGFPV